MEGGGILEDANQRWSEKDLGKLMAADELADTERRLTQKVGEEFVVWEAATARRGGGMDCQDGMAPG